MAQDLTVNIKTTSDVPQAMDKAKSATVSFGKQVEDIQKKFSTAFKDIFLGFTAPMVILNQAINMISGAIEKSRQQVRDALADAEKGENKYMRAGTVASAREVSSRRQDALDRKNAKLAAEALAEEQLKEGGVLGFGGEADAAIAQYEAEGAKMGKMEAFKRDMKGALFYLGLSDMSKDKDMQDVLERRAQARMADSPEGKAAAAAAKQKEAAEMQIAKQKELDSKPTSFKGPEGFSNVVGVGANPVMEAMTAQLEEQRKQTALLERMANAGFSPADGWMTAPASTAAPSRSAMLGGKK